MISQVTIKRATVENAQTSVPLFDLLALKLRHIP